MTRLVIVRHGNTFETGEEPRRVGARTDLPLTAAGVEQARALGWHFAKNRVQFDRVLSSPLIRTRQTASEIVDKEPETADFLNEIDHGADENLTEDAVIARIGAEALERWEQSLVAPPGWDVGADRRIAAWREFARTADGTILLVTSNGAARFALAALGLMGEDGAQKLRTGSYGVIDLYGAKARLIGWNQRPGGPGDKGLF
ncbi:histidine phosphatase family protein [Devosia sp. CN2-171]|uniref:histidine phosphatase family protein n=1 Tax=Devosia sp. CN2-171 TaxID=3400909 RepID=UPI003BF7A45E